MKALAVRRNAREEDVVGRVLCHDVRGRRNEIVFRKGHTIRPGDLAPLLDAPWTEIHLLQFDHGDVGQREAGRRLAESLAHEEAEVAPAGHRHVLRARRKGLLKIETAVLRRLNSIDGIAVFTLRDGEVVQPEQVVAEAQITPLAIDEHRLAEAEAMARGAGVVRVLPFGACHVVIWTRSDRISGDRMLPALTARLGWFGCSVAEVIDLPAQAEAIQQSMEGQAGSGAKIFLVSGSNALDPLDPVFRALQHLGATMRRIGLPVHPGTLLWLAEWRGIHIVGLPSCGHGTQTTGFDLVLPRLLAEGRITNEEIAAFGEGGILRSASVPPLDRRPTASGEEERPSILQGNEDIAVNP